MGFEAFFLQKSQTQFAHLREQEGEERGHDIPGSYGKSVRPAFSRFSFASVEHAASTFFVGQLQVRVLQVGPSFALRASSTSFFFVFLPPLTHSSQWTTREHLSPSSRPACLSPCPSLVRLHVARGNRSVGSTEIEARSLDGSFFSLRQDSTTRARKEGWRGWEGSMDAWWSAWSRRGSVPIPGHFRYFQEWDNPSKLPPMGNKQPLG